jgi:hypothetical protein
MRPYEISTFFLEQPVDVTGWEAVILVGVRFDVPAFLHERVNTAIVFEPVVNPVLAVEIGDAGNVVRHDGFTVLVEFDDAARGVPVAEFALWLPARASLGDGVNVFGDLVGFVNADVEDFKAFECLECVGCVESEEVRDRAVVPFKARIKLFVHAEFAPQLEEFDECGAVENGEARACHESGAVRVTEAHLPFVLAESGGFGCAEPASEVKF